MEKFKKTMKREDGFTLVELLAVIVILGIILAIAIPAIGNVISKSRTDAKASEYDLIIDAGRIYLTSNEGTSVSVEDLVEGGYIEQRGGEEIDEDFAEAYVVLKDNAYILASDDAGASPIDRPGSTTTPTE